MDEGDLFGNCKTALAPHNWGKDFSTDLAISLQGGRFRRGMWLGSRRQYHPWPRVPENTTALWGWPLPKGPDIPERRS